MKSERRHELQQNYLAEVLGTYLKKVEQHSKVIAAVVAVVVVAVVAWALYRSAAVGTRSDATLELLQNVGAGDPEALAAVADRYGDTAAGTLAKLYHADGLLAEGINSQFEDREAARNQLNEALGRYGEVAAAAGRDTFLLSRAHLGMARTHEALGDLDKAVESYRQVVAAEESEAMTRLAEQRIEHLKSPETREFLAWFDRQDFRPADPAAPPTAPGGFDLPDLPDLDLPDIAPQTPDAPAGAPTDMPVDPAAPETPSPDDPAAPETEPAAPQPAAPAEDAPADPPADNETPAASPEAASPEEPETPEPQPAEPTDSAEPTEPADPPEDR